MPVAKAAQAELPSSQDQGSCLCWRTSTRFTFHSPPKQQSQVLICWPLLPFSLSKHLSLLIRFPHKRTWAEHFASALLPHAPTQLSRPSQPLCITQRTTTALSSWPIPNPCAQTPQKQLLETPPSHGDLPFGSLPQLLEPKVANLCMDQRGAGWTGPGLSASNIQLLTCIYWAPGKARHRAKCWVKKKLEDTILRPHKLTTKNTRQ